MEKPNKTWKPVDLVADDQTRATWNPLHWLTLQQVEMIIDAARSGRISQIQLLYSLVEASDLTLAMCMTRRTAALPDWTIKRRDTRRYRGYDEKLAQEQEAYLYDQFVQCEDSGTLLPAIQTLHSAVFRGLGVVEPIYDSFGLTRIVSLDPWNFAVDYTRHDILGQYPLYWNPSGADVLDFTDTLERIPEEQIVANFAKAPIDNFGLQIYLAEQLGFEAYSKLIARRGLPATYIIAPENLETENLESWARKAVECAKGGSGAFPNGTTVTSQAVDPGNAQAIQDFLEYMSKLIVLASTGGTLTSLAQPTGMGSNVADVQQDVFKTIVRHDAFKIGDLINRGIARKLLDWQFPGKPHLAFFDLSDEAKQSPEKYLADAVAAKNAGLSIDLNQLQELTGYKLTKEEPKGGGDTGSTWTVPTIPTVPAAPSPNREEVEEKVVENEAPEEAQDEVPYAPRDEVNTPADGQVEEAAEEAIAQLSGDEVKHGVSVLKAFDKMLAPLRALWEKLFKASTKVESDAATAELQEEIDRLEQAEDTELQAEIAKFLKEEFEKGGVVENEEDHWVPVTEEEARRMLEEF